MKRSSQLFSAFLLVITLSFLTTQSVLARAERQADQAQPARSGEGNLWLDVQIALFPLDDPGLFDLAVTDQEGNVIASAADLGQGGTLGGQSVPPGLYNVTVDAGASTLLGLYISVIECRDENGQGALVASCSNCTTLADISVASDATVVCTVTNINAQPPLAVTVAQFDATCEHGTPLLTWTTNQEIDIQGFNLYRGASLAQPDVQINPDLIPAAAPGSTQGATYAWTDLSAAPEGLHGYWLEVINLDGSSSLLPPVSTTCLTPTAVTVTNLEAAALAPAATGGQWAVFALLTGPAVVALWRWQRRMR